MPAALSQERIEEIELETLIPALRRRDDVVSLLKRGGIGLELGVAEGSFSARILKRDVLSYLYSIDMWAGDRGHDIEQYRIAIRQLEPYKEKNTLLRMRFDEALYLFPDNYFDFIYVDGYAHTGEEQGQTLRDWFPKLKVGGIFAGDDYSAAWPLVIIEVDKFVAENDLQLHVVQYQDEVDAFSQYPTWLVRKA